MTQSRREGTDGEGRPWHVGVLYAAPDDREMGGFDLVGIVTRFGHIGCLHWRHGRDYRPFVVALEGQVKYLIVPVICGIEPGVEPTVMLPDLDDLAQSQMIGC
ncbi:hypothetical protein GCM10009558_003930 [Virgisporangium aurantiacum]